MDPFRSHALTVVLLTPAQVADRCGLAPLDARETALVRWWTAVLQDWRGGAVPRRRARGVDRGTAALHIDVGRLSARPRSRPSGAPTMTQPLSPLGLAALTLAVEYGLAVFPVAPGAKTPLTPNGHLGASSHPEAITEWWIRWPDANLGAVPGSMDCVVIDVDGANGERLAQSLGVLDTPTLESVTARGAHHWYRLPRGVTVGNLARPELDVRSSAGYVIVPPSIHPSGAVAMPGGERWTRSPPSPPSYWPGSRLRLSRRRTGASPHAGRSRP